MDFFDIGKIKIPVRTEVNSRLRSKRLSVDHEGVFVELPKQDKGAGLHSFLESKVDWIFDKWATLQPQAKHSPWPERFVSGSKVLFNGRWEQITLNKSKARRFDYGPKGFIICSDESNEKIKSLFIDFFKRQTLEVATRFVPEETKIKIIKRKDRWAFCDSSNVIHLGWDLAFLPKKIVEYVVVHEVTHLKHKHHGPEFWADLSVSVPDYEMRASLLIELEGQFNF